MIKFFKKTFAFSTYHLAGFGLLLFANTVISVTFFTPYWTQSHNWNNGLWQFCFEKGYRNLQFKIGPLGGCYWSWSEKINTIIDFKKSNTFFK